MCGGLECSGVAHAGRCGASVHLEPEDRHSVPSVVTSSDPPSRTAHTVEHPLRGRAARTDASVSCEPTMTAGRSDAEPVERLAPGTLVDRYVIDQALGEGGMGVVYRAFDPKLERSVALKLVSVQASRREMRDRLRARLLREAQALAQLTHPNVVSVYDTGVTDDRVFIAMELVEGEPLTEYCAPSKGRTTDELLSAYLAAGEGLAAAHRAGLVHRDFKPHNVIMGVDGRTRVIDFGLARVDDLLDSRSSSGTLSSDSGSYFDIATSSSDGSPSVRRSSDAALTELGAVMGTPRYMAPEQHEGKIADHRADQYSFCAALYQALAGVAPFAGKERNAIFDNITRRAFSEPLAGRSIPRRMRPILERGLATRPEARFEDMDSLLAALRGSRGKRSLIALAVLATVLPLLMLGWAQWQAQPYERCLSSAEPLSALWPDGTSMSINAGFGRAAGTYGTETFTRVAGRLAGLSETYNSTHRDSCQRALRDHTQSDRWLDERMACLDRVRHRTSLLLEQWKDADRAQVDAALTALESVESLARCDSAQIALAAARPSEMSQREFQAFEKALDRAITLHDVGRFKEAHATLSRLWPEVEPYRPSALSASVAYHLGAAEAQLSEIDDAQRTLLLAIEDAVAIRNPPVELKAMVELAQVQLMRGQSTTGHMLALTSRWRLRAEHDDPASELRTLRLLGYAEEGAENLDVAAAYYDEALALTKRKMGPLHVAQVNAYYGKLRSLQGRHAEGAEMIQQAVAAFEKAYGRKHPSTIIWLTFLAETEQRLGRFSVAADHMQEVLAADRERFGEVHEDVAIDYRVLADIALERGEPRKARRLYRKSRDLFKVIYGPDHPQVTEVSSFVARTNLFLGDADGARADCDAVFVTRSASEEHDRAHDYARLVCARIMVTLETGARALSLARQVHRAAAASHPRPHPVLARADVVLVYALADAGLVEEAESLARQVVTDIGLLAHDPVEHASAHFALARAIHRARPGDVEVREAVSRALALLGTPLGFTAKYLRSQIVDFQATL